MNKEKIDLTITAVKKSGTLIVFNNRYKTSLKNFPDAGNWAVGETYSVEVTSEPDPQYNQQWMQPEKNAKPKGNAAAPQETKNTPVSVGKHDYIRLAIEVLKLEGQPSELSQVFQVAEQIRVWCEE